MWVQLLTFKLLLFWIVENEHFEFMCIRNGKLGISNVNFTHTRTLFIFLHRKRWEWVKCKIFQFHTIYLVNASLKICSAFKTIGFVGWTSIRCWLTKVSVFTSSTSSSAVVHQRSSRNISESSRSPPRKFVLKHIPSHRIANCAVSCKNLTHKEFKAENKACNCIQDKKREREKENNEFFDNKKKREKNFVSCLSKEH